MAANKLTKVERNGDIFWIEDPETGSGLCMSIVPAENTTLNTYTKNPFYDSNAVKNDICFTRRVEWKTSRSPCLRLNDKKYKFA